ncbi:MAG: S26 family signal peptidase [Poseidonia sp.]|jgi:signal peptidase I
MSDAHPLKTLVLELALAVGMIACLIGAMFIHTGSMPPLVVVESASMVHDPSGEVGSIDAGDLILVHNQPASTVVTFAEATDVNHPAYGYAQHGMEGDVIIYDKNGEGGTPIIHRAMLRVVAAQTVSPDRTGADPCPSGTYDALKLDTDGQLGTCILTWSVPGTTVSDAENVTVIFDGNQAGYYDCKRPAHAGVEAHLVVWQWQPAHEGILTLGDNNKCSVDQGASATNGSAGVHSPSGVVGPIRDGWILGVAGGELPWLGTVKLMAGGPNSYGTGDVPSSSFLALGTVLAAVVFAPVASESLFRRLLAGAPELKHSPPPLDAQEES